MRAASILACALLLLAGCKKSADPPPAALTSPDNSNPDPNKGKQAKGGKDPSANKNGGKADPGKQKGNNGGTKAVQPEADGLAFDPQDPQKTLTWLVKRSAQSRSAPGDAAARQAYEAAVKAAENQKIHWTLKVVRLYSLGVDPAKKGVVLETVKSPAEARCSLRVALSPDPEIGTVKFALLPPAGAEFRPGDRVTVAGVVDRVAVNSARCDFEVRLRDGYTLTAPK